MSGQGKALFFPNFPDFLYKTPEFIECYPKTAQIFRGGLVEGTATDLLPQIHIQTQPHKHTHTHTHAHTQRHQREHKE